MKVERFFYIGLAIVVAGLLVMGMRLESVLAYDSLGPRPFPVLIFGLLLACLILLATKPNAFYGDWDVRGVLGLKVLMLLATLLFYSVAFNSLGFIVSTIMAMTCMARLFAAPWLKALVIASIMSLYSFLLFDRFLDVPLPLGLLESVLS